ncbi:citrate:proton symporter [Clostridium sp. AN503]|uniref:CitMHS family transporter n=1 Tax=Clostridium sp. AN503 TaxID=3160598 RepID=UPI003457729A
MLYAMVGYAVIVIMMFMILKKKATPAFCFSILPVIGAAVCGFGFTEIMEFINTGMGSVWKTAILFIFSVCYFSVMNDAGLFDPLVQGLVKKAGNNITMIMLATSLIAVVAHMDGACASTYLITIPVMLPIFKKMKLNPLMLLLLVGLSTGVMNLVPWGGPTIRAATAIGMDATELWISMIPMQIFGLLASLGAAVICGRVETKRLKKAGIDLSALDISGETSVAETDSELKRPKLFWVNLILTVGVIGALIKSGVTPYLIFLFGTMIALAVNYPDMKVQGQLLKKYAPSCIDLTVTLMAAGVFLGIFANSGIITSMAQVLISILPGFMTKYLYIIMGILGGPLGIIMGPDPYYYAVMPLVIETVAPYGITAAQVAHAMLIGENVVLSVSPCVPANYLAFGMSGIELNEHLKFSFKWEWLVSILMLVFAVIYGIV